MRTFNGGNAATSNQLGGCGSTSFELRERILAREESVRQWRKSLPRRKRPAHERPGPCL